MDGTDTCSDGSTGFTGLRAAVIAPHIDSRHVIVSNHVPELDILLQCLGLHRHFLAVVNSPLVGWEKPHRRIFETALERVGRPEHVWMVGDNPVADIAGRKPSESPESSSVQVRKGYNLRCSGSLREHHRPGDLFSALGRRGKPAAVGSVAVFSMTVAVARAGSRAEAGIGPVRGAAGYRRSPPGGLRPAVRRPRGRSAPGPAGGCATPCRPSRVGCRGLGPHR
ncbi:HAD-IA family hydrolase [Streptomyces fuscichromogenes]|uniref:HAD-IA family hydrolase n=1 Tax=Streptomyces fuscichromogenes TaxID=1324013 RepID=UPI003570B14C